MKKITSYAFLIMFVLSGSASFGGNGPGKNVVNAFFDLTDFNAGIPNTWANVDVAGSGVKWKYTTTGADNGGLPFANGTALAAPATVGNGWVIFDSDSAFTDPCDGYLISDAIDCSTRVGVNLSLYSYFAQYKLTSMGKVQVSNDSINWTTVYSAEAGLAMDETSNNPEAVDVDISAIADGQAKVYIRLHYVGNGDYFWQVDDIGLYEAGSVNAGVTAILTPVTSCTTLTNAELVKVTIKNFGTLPLVNPEVAFQVDANVPDTEMVVTTINAGATYDYTFTATADLSGNGVHRITAFTVVASDVDPTNNLDSTYIYAGPRGASSFSMNFDLPTNYIGWLNVDANTDGTTWMPSPQNPKSGGYSGAYNEISATTANDWMISPCIDFPSTATSYALSFYHRTFTTLTDATIEVVLLNSQVPTASPVLTIVPATLITNDSYLESLSSFAVPSAGTYYIGWHITDGAKFTSLNIDDINLYFDVKTPSISNAEVIVYPNPNNGTFSIANLKSFNGTVQVTVLDMMGRTVSEQSVNGVDKVTMNLEGQAAGVYSVRISNDAQVLNKLITITK